MPRTGPEVYRTPGHPFTTAAFVAACWIVVAATFYHYPKDSLIGLGIALAGLPVYFIWGALHPKSQGQDTREQTKWNLDK